MNSVTEKASAKVNLNLQILGKRADGYHELSSLFVFTDFGDELVFTESDDFSLKITGEYADFLSDNQNNSIIKAAKKLAEAAGINSGVSVKLKKNIPVAAGIGGGTADAAATFRGLLKLWNLDVSDKELRSLLCMSGADVPASYESKSVMVGGIGDVLTEAPLLPENIPILLVNPRKDVSTKDIFNLCDSKGSSSKAFVFRDKYSDVADLVNDLRQTSNDLKEAAEAVCPDIEKVLTALKNQNCLYENMSGSGATCFALFANENDVSKAEDNLRKFYPEWWIKGTFIP